MTSRSATLIGLTAILMWSLLAVLTVATGKIPAFQLVAMTFAVGALAWLAKRWLAKKVAESGTRALPAVVSQARTPLKREQPQPVRHTEETQHVRVESYLWIRRITTWRREQD